MKEKCTKDLLMKVGAFQKGGHLQSNQVSLRLLGFGVDSG